MCSNAMREVSGPVIATTLVMVAVFVPVATMVGITGKLYQQFAITIVVSVVFSSINALSLSPVLCTLLMKKLEPSKRLLGGFSGLSIPFFIGLPSVMARVHPASQVN